MATGSVNPKRGKVVNIPDQTVTIGTATDGGTGTSAFVAFTVGSVTTGGPVNYFTATSTPGSFTGNASTSPITVSGLTTGTAYTFKVKAGNATGFSSAGESAASNSLTPILPTSFESIATLTGTGTETSLTFSSIPSTYKHLQIRFSARSTRTNSSPGSENLNIQFNGDTGANYSLHSMRTDGAGQVFAAGSGSTSQINVNNGVIASGSSNTLVYSAGIVDIHDYSLSTKNKTLSAFGGYEFNTSGRVALSSGLRVNTAAITSITLQADGQQFASGSVFSLYGIKGE